MVNRIFSKRTLNSPVFRMAVLMIVVLVAGASLQDSFLTLRNVQSICKQLAEYGILAVAVFICMLSGGIDSVSYTHLDVYKRQFLFWSNKRISNC